ncbi:MAG: glycoside hydrolase [Lentisphaerae bacterium]|nr:glycoside hydrolase [Lentisphaerota bacterium]
MATLDAFFARRMGLFIHWGLYAIPGWHEQHQLRLRTPRAEYARLAAQFHPTAFDPDAWIDLAEAAGMSYLVVTAKHLDGFCLWDTATTEFKVTRTPFGRDVLAELAEACHRRGMPLGLYYSAIDQHCTFYPNRGRGHELAGPEPGDTPEWERFVDIMERQITELCTRYGRLAVFWWDSGPEIGLTAPRLNPLLRRLQPGILINNRGLSADGDFSTPERDYSPEFDAQKRFAKPVEACQAVGAESWGWRQDEDYFSTRYLLGEVDRVLARGGNYLLNVGPRPDGTVDPTSAGILKAIGDWYGRVKESLTDVETVEDIVTDPAVPVTRRGNTLYLHLHRPLNARRLLVTTLTARPERAILLNDGRPIRTSTELLPRYYRKGERPLRLCDLPVDEFAGSVMVLRLDLA